jgi:hypothetical protein
MSAIYFARRRPFAAHVLPGARLLSRGLVSKIDNAGVKITDPATADRGRYTIFCGYFYACKSQKVAWSLAWRGEARPSAKPGGSRVSGKIGKHSRVRWGPD